MNACGTIGILHGIGNMIEDNPDLIEKGSWLDTFYSETAGKSPEDTGQYIMGDGGKTLKQNHKSGASEGQS